MNKKGLVSDQAFCVFGEEKRELCVFVFCFIR